MNKLEEDPPKAHEGAGRGRREGGRAREGRPEGEEVAFQRVRFRPTRTAPRHLEHALGALPGRRHPAVGRRYRFPRAARGHAMPCSGASRTAYSATTCRPTRCARRVVERLQRLYGWRVEPAWVVFVSGVVPGLHLAARHLVRAGRACRWCRRRSITISSAPRLSPRASIRDVPLVLSAGRWVFDEDRAEGRGAAAYAAADAVQSAESRRHHLHARGTGAPGRVRAKSTTSSSVPTKSTPKSCSTRASRTCRSPASRPRSRAAP